MFASRANSNDNYAANVPDIEKAVAP